MKKTPFGKTGLEVSPLGFGGAPIGYRKTDQERVGSILNLINQGDALFSGRRLDWLKLALTYIVPYCVATYGAVAFRLEAMRRETRPRN